LPKKMSRGGRSTGSRNGKASWSTPFGMTAAPASHGAAARSPSETSDELSTAAARAAS
jgi:hypothetical protein